MSTETISNHLNLNGKMHFINNSTSELFYKNASVLMIHHDFTTIEKNIDSCFH
jgi:ABC-type Mn2+/Zn2+ transport system ATPase subunit